MRAALRRARALNPWWFILGFTGSFWMCLAWAVLVQ